MGYYSEVAIAMKKTDYKRMIEEIEEKFGNDDYFPEFVTSAAENAPECLDEEFMFLHWDSVKWYEDYKEIEFIMKFIRQLEAYEFVRFGEGSDDNEMEICTDCYFLGMQRSICFE